MQKREKLRIGSLAVSLLVFGMAGSGCQSVKDSIADTAAQLSESASQIPGVTPAIHGIRVDVSKPFLIASAEVKGGHGFLTHPVLWRTSSNRIALTYHLLGDTPGGNSGVVEIDWPLYSDDGGTNWIHGDPMEWVDGPPPERTVARKGDYLESVPTHYSGAVGLLRDGRLLCHKRGIELRGYDQFRFPQVWSSGDNRWHGPQFSLVRYPKAGGFLYPVSRLVETHDGALCFLAQNESGIRLGCDFFRSLDGGKSFDFVSIVGERKDTPWGNEGPTEGALIETPKGDLLAIVRTGSMGSGDELKLSADMLEARSTDGGVTWRRKRMRIGGVWPQLERLDNGILVLGYGRPGNYLAFSSDDGRTWLRKTTMSSAMDPTSGYLAIEKVGPNRLLVVYDLYHTYLQRFWVRTPSKVNALFGRFVDVEYRGEGIGPASR